MFFPSILSVDISEVLGSKPLPILFDSSPAFSRDPVCVTCDCCGRVYLASF